MSTDLRWVSIPLLAVALALAGCAAPADSSGSEPSSATTPDGAEDTSAEAEDASRPAASLDDPCSLLSSAELEAIVGTALAEGRTTQTSMQQNDDKWAAIGCRWEIDDEEEIVLRTSQPSGFTEIAYSCLALSGAGDDAVELSGLGQTAWWKSLTFFVPTGRLRVCADGFFFDVDVKREAEDPVLREQAWAIAEIVYERTEG